MIAPDSAAELRAERRFDLVAAVLIGVIAVLAALLAVVEMNASQASTRANLEAARLAADLSARIAVSGQASDSALGAQQTAFMLSMESAARGIAGIQNDDATSIAIGNAEESAFTELRAALAATSATTGGKPVDPYTAGLLNATTPQLLSELAEQNRQADLAEAATSQEHLAVLRLSFLALAGVLTGLAAVLKEGRGGWISLISACAMSAAAGLLGLLAATASRRTRTWFVPCCLATAERGHRRSGTHTRAPFPESASAQFPRTGNWQEPCCAAAGPQRIGRPPVAQSTLSAGVEKAHPTPERGWRGRHCDPIPAWSELAHTASLATGQRGSSRRTEAAATRPSNAAPEAASGGLGTMAQCPIP
ncbi:MAG: hypothetical protein ABSE58_05480 [Candidatus Limnocylindrales bacterium]